MSVDESCYKIEEVEDPNMFPPRSKSEEDPNMLPPISKAKPDDSTMVKYCECPDGGYYYWHSGEMCFNGPENSYTDDQILYSEGTRVCLFWNLEHCPISQGADLSVIYKRLKLCLHRMGVHGFLFINTYGGKLSHTESELDRAYIKHTPSPPPKEWTITGQICVEILRLISLWPVTSNFVVIAKQDSDSEMTRVLQSLQSRHHQIVLTIKPHDSLLGSADSIYQCAEFVGGGMNRFRPLRRHKWPAPPDLATGVFWDAWDCPFPPTWTADSIYDAVQTCFTREVALDKDMSMWAYVDEEKDSEFLGMKTWTSNIEFHPGRDTSAARHERMLHDILLWAISNPRTTKNLLIAGKVNQEMYRVLEVLEDIISCCIVLIIPGRDTVPTWDNWPLYLLNDVYFIGCEENEIQSEGTDPERHNSEG